MSESLEIRPGSFWRVTRKSYVGFGQVRRVLSASLVHGIRWLDVNDPKRIEHFTPSARLWNHLCSPEARS